MTSQVTLLLVCMLFSKALSLICQQCLTSSEACGEIICTDQCYTVMTSVYTSYSNESHVITRSCGTSQLCDTWSLNLGMIRYVNRIKCCSTDLCNAEKLPVFPKQEPNLRQCYTCNGNDCSGTVNCQGNEDYCITYSAKYGTYSMSIKGCASKFYCGASGSTSIPGIGTSAVDCCQGNLCNGNKSNTGSSSGGSSGSSTGSNTGSSSGGSSGSSTGSNTGSSSGGSSGSSTGSNTGSSSGGSSGSSTGSNTGSSSGNGAESLTLSFLPMIIPVLSSVLFY